MYYDNFFGRYTEKAWDCVAKLPQYCEKYSTQYVEATHLLKSILDEGPGGLGQRILVKAGVDVGKIERNLDAFLNRQPKISDTSTKAMGNTMMSCLAKANDVKKDFGDQFISTEHLLLAAAETDGYSKRVFADAGYKSQQIKDAVKAIRGTSKVTRCSYIK